VNRKSSIATVADVARAAGVGAITVSRAVNGNGYVSEEKRKRIAVAIKKLGYRQNQAARVLKGNRARMIGVIIPDLADSFFGKCASAIESYAASHGYMTLIVASNRDRRLQRREVDMMVGQNIAGLIVVPSFPAVDIKPLTEMSVPIVAIDRPAPGTAADEVVVENLEGSKVAVSHLIDHGHQRIACVGYDKDSFAISRRIQGYVAAMKGARLKPEIYDEVSTLDETSKLLRKLLKKIDHPTAIFSLNNVATQHVLCALRHLGISVPKKMALIGFDDLELASLLPSPLTVVRQPALNLGNQAARLLFDRIAGTKMTEGDFGVKLVLPVEFVIRSSCGCAAGN